MDADSKTLIVEDTLSADNEVVLDWLLHSLSQPTVDDGVVYVKRNGITLKIEVLEGLKNKAIISDRFDTDLNEGIPETDHAVMPPQYHIKWQSNSKKEHYIKVKFSVLK